MRPRERRETGEQDLFRSRLDQIISMDHALVKLARTIDWRFLEEKFGVVYKDGAGQPPLPTRLMAGLAILKHTYNLSDEVVCELWIENPYYQYFCGEEFFQHRLPLDRSSMTHWRNRMGEERLQALLQESLAVATRSGAMKPGDLARVIVDTTVQSKNVTFPTDAKLQAVQARQQGFAHAQDLSRPRHPGHCPQDRRRSPARNQIRLSAKPRPTGARAGARAARPQGLQPARARGGVHRQGQAAQALRVWGQGQRCHHPQAQ